MIAIRFGHAPQLLAQELDHLRIAPDAQRLGDGAGAPVVHPRRRLGLKIDTQPVRGFEGRLRRTPSVEADVIETVFLDHAKHSFPLRHGHRRMASPGIDGAVERPTQEHRPTVQPHLFAHSLDMTEAEEDRGFVMLAGLRFQRGLKPVTNRMKLVPRLRGFGGLEGHFIGANAGRTEDFGGNLSEGLRIVFRQKAEVDLRANRVFARVRHPDQRAHRPAVRPGTATSERTSTRRAAWRVIAPIIPFQRDCVSGPYAWVIVERLWIMRLSTRTVSRWGPGLKGPSSCRWSATRLSHSPALRPSTQTSVFHRARSIRKATDRYRQVSGILISR